MSKIEKLTQKILEPFINDKGIDIYDIEYVKEGKDWFLRVLIDKPDGVNIDDCEMVSHYLSKRLDEVDPIDHSYTLEVSSPGIERPLKRPEHYKRYEGRKVYIKLYQPIEKSKELIGILRNYDEENQKINIEIGDEVISIPKSMISSAHLYFEM